jgi:hypothetical protein
MTTILEIEAYSSNKDFHRFHGKLNDEIRLYQTDGNHLEKQAITFLKK